MCDMQVTLEFNMPQQHGPFGEGLDTQIRAVILYRCEFPCSGVTCGYSQKRTLSNLIIFCVKGFGDFLIAVEAFQREHYSLGEHRSDEEDYLMRQVALATSYHDEIVGLNDGHFHVVNVVS